MKTFKIILVNLFLLLLSNNNSKFGVVKGCFGFSTTKSSSVPPLIASKVSETDIEDVSYYQTDWKCN